MLDDLPVYRDRVRPWLGAIPDELTQAGQAIATTLYPAQDRPGPRREPSGLTTSHDAEPARDELGGFVRSEPLPELHPGTPPTMRTTIKGLRVDRETEKAVLVFRPGGNSRQVWMPKSAVRFARAWGFRLGETLVDIDLPVWLYAQVYRQL